jgi:formiminotetrahydrofolate cyclodeaminase
MTNPPAFSRLDRLSIDDFLSAVASVSPVPGGGPVTALAGALGAALTGMVARLTIGRERYAPYDAEMRDLLPQADALRQKLTDLMDADAAAYTSVMAAYRLPTDTQEQRAERVAAIQSALRGAVETPLAAAAACVDVLRLAVQAARHGNRNAAGDAAVAALMAHAGLQGAGRNVQINLRAVRDQAFCREVERRVAALLVEGESALAAALSAVDDRG